MAGNDSYTKSLLHFNGSDASTTFTDSAAGATITWTASGNAQLDTAQKKFGTASGLFDGTGDYIESADNAVWTPGASDFTIDCWVRRAAKDALMFIISKSDSLGSGTAATKEWLIRLEAATNLCGFICSSGTAQKNCYTTTALSSTSDWYHIAVVRNVNTLKMYLNGTEESNTDITGFTIQDSAYKPTIGRYGEYNGFYFNGWIDEFRFTNGLARWTANFTPPTAEYDSIVGYPWYTQWQ